VRDRFSECFTRFGADFFSCNCDRRHGHKSIMISHTPETPCPGLSPGNPETLTVWSFYHAEENPRTPVRRRHGLLSQDWAFNLSPFICFLLAFIQVIFNFIGHSHIYSFEYSLGFNALHLHLR
jgi:hypothetical protein